MRKHGLIGSFVVAASIACGWIAPAMAAEPARPTVVQQKGRLVEQLLASPRVQEVEAGNDADAKALVERARALLAEARAAANPADGEAKLNEALRLTGQATRARLANRGADDGQAQRNSEVRKQTESYRASLVTAAQARGLPPPPQLSEIDRQLHLAQSMAGEGRHADAAKPLAEAYRIAVESLSAMRSGETVTIELKFDTPVQEFDYEFRRFQSHELLVDMMLEERHPTGSVREAIDQNTQKAQALRAKAVEAAAAGDHKTGIKTLEDATKLLVRALQAAGMPVY